MRSATEQTAETRRGSFSRQKAVYGAKKNVMKLSCSAPFPVVLPSQREARDNQDAVNIILRYKKTLFLIEKLNKHLTVFVFAGKKQSFNSST